MSYHQDVTWIVGTADNDLVPLGKDLGLREAVAFLTNLADQQQPGTYRDGITTTADAVEGVYQLSDEYMGRLHEVDLDKLDFDPTGLLAALTAIIDGSKHLGWTAAIQEAREHCEGDAARPDDLDPDDEDEDPDEHAEQVDYANGARYAAQQLVTHFGIDPDPAWDPS